MRTRKATAFKVFGGSKGRAAMLAGLVISMTAGADRGRAQAWPVPCERVANAGQRVAVVAARSAFDTKWLKADKFWATAFETKMAAPQKPNPFATKAEPAPEIPQVLVKGVIRVDGLQCQVTETTAPAEIVVEIYGTGVRFFEPGPGWSAPLARGLLSAVGVTTRDGKPVVAEKAEYATVILPDATLRQPTSAEVPPLTPSGARQKSGKR